MTPAAAPGHVVCGLYTPDYERWVKPLREALDFWSQPHDFAPVEKATGGWEARAVLWC